MRVSKDHLAYILDQLAPFASVTAKRMFDGMGLYVDGFFFGIIVDALYFKTDDFNRPDFLARTCKPFEFEKPKTGKVVSRNYFQVPEDVIDDPDELKIWARKALGAAMAVPQKAEKPAKSKKKKR